MSLNIGYSCFQVLELQLYTTMLSCKCCWEPNLGLLHVCKANILPTEPHPLPLGCFLMEMHKRSTYCCYTADVDGSLGGPDSPQCWGRDSFLQLSTEVKPSAQHPWHLYLSHGQQAEIGCLAEDLRVSSCHLPGLSGFLVGAYSYWGGSNQSPRQGACPFRQPAQSPKQDLAPLTQNTRRAFNLKISANILFFTLLCL